MPPTHDVNRARAAMDAAQAILNEEGISATIALSGATHEGFLVSVVFERAADRMRSSLQPEIDGIDIDIRVARPFRARPPKGA